MLKIFRSVIPKMMSQIWLFATKNGNPDNSKVSDKSRSCVIKASSKVEISILLKPKFLMADIKRRAGITAKFVKLTIIWATWF